MMIEPAREIMAHKQKSFEELRDNIEQEPSALPLDHLVALARPRF